MPVLRPPGSPPPWPDPDADQARAIGHRGGALLVRGAAGTGKTVTALRIVADRVDGGLSTDDVLLLAPTRRAAAQRQPGRRRALRPRGDRRRGRRGPACLGCRGARRPAAPLAPGGGGRP